MQNYIDLKNELRNVQNFSLRNESYKQHETASSMGSIMIDKSYLITQYHDYVKTLIENVKIPKSIQKTFQVEDKPVKILDIGAATGANDLDLVKQGAIVIANDLSKSLPDLLRFRSRLTQEEKDRVWFNTNSFPDKLDQPENSFDAILLSHVAHYLTGPQIRYGFKKIYRWLKPDGKLFFQALTQYSIPFQWRRKTVANLLKLDHEWPGWFGNAPKQIEYELGVQVADMYSKNSFPTFGHPLQPQILERELLKAGFIIESLGYATLNNIKSPLTYQEHEFYVMNECDHGSEVEFTQSMIESKLSLHKEFKVLLEEDKKTYCAYKELHKNGGPSTQALKENCKIVIKNCIPQQDQKTILSQLETASMQDSFSPAQFIEDLRQLYPFCPKVDQSASPSSVYYFLNKTLFGLRSMATVQAIVKKPATD
jgi:SAM-dependent methyltransferase